MKQRLAAFTLFELVLAIALSATLLVLIGTAINLYLVRIDASRQQVEEAQLARSILSMIATDLRATIVFQPQDTSSLEQLLASTAEFDVDEIDEPTDGSQGGSGGNSPGVTVIDTGGDSEGDSGGDAAGGFGSGSSLGGGAGGASAQSSVGAEETTQYALGVNGTTEELIVDVARLPRVDEIMAPAATGAMVKAQQAGRTRPSDEKTVRYFVRQGDAIDASSAAATSLDPEGQQSAGGLVRQEIDRAARTWAEQAGNQAVLESGQALVAPEVAQVRFRYFDGSAVAEYWDMRERQTPPAAVEVTIWIVSPDGNGELPSSSSRPSSVAAAGRQYQQTVQLPVAVSSGGSGSGGGDGDGTGGGGQDGSGSGGGSQTGPAGGGGQP